MLASESQAKILGEPGISVVVQMIKRWPYRNLEIKKTNIIVYNALFMVTFESTNIDVNLSRIRCI